MVSILHCPHISVVPLGSDTGLDMWLVWGNRIRQKWQCTIACVSVCAPVSLLSPWEGLAWAFLLVPERKLDKCGSEPTCRHVIGPAEPHVHDGAQPKSTGPWDAWKIIGHFYAPQVLRWLDNICSNHLFYCLRNVSALLQCYLSSSFLNPMCNHFFSRYYTRKKNHLCFLSLSFYLSLMSPSPLVIFPLPANIPI